MPRSLRGADRVRFLEQLVVADVQGLAPGTAALSLLTNSEGGIVDDLVITNCGDYLYVVSNAGCADKDLAHLRAHLFGDAQLEVLRDRVSLVALQGLAPHRAAVCALACCAHVRACAIRAR